MRKSLLSLKDKDCRFAVNSDTPYLFCAEPVMPGESYCRQHQEVCYGKALPRTKRWLSPAFDLMPVPQPPPEPVKDLIEAWNQNQDHVTFGTNPEQE